MNTLDNIVLLYAEHPEDYQLVDPSFPSFPSDTKDATEEWYQSMEYRKACEGVAYNHLTCDLDIQVKAIEEADTHSIVGWMIDGDVEDVNFLKEYHKEMLLEE